MADTHQKGGFQADIPESAVDEALRSVEKVARGGDGVAVEVEGDPAAGVDPGALASEVESLKAQLELSQAKGRELLEKLKEEHDRLLRSAADLENYRKRSQREREDVQRFGVEKLVKDLLPAVDDLDRALAAAAPGDPLVDGVKLVRAGLEAALGRHGVKAFSAMGAAFDPARHEALLQVTTADEAPGTVVLEHARGFMMHDRLVRPAMVGVAAAPPKDAAADAGKQDPAGGAGRDGGGG